MPSLATKVQLGQIDPVIGALALRYVSEPHLAVEVVTGAAEWPSPDGETAEELAVRAADLADELTELRNCGQRWIGTKPVTRLWIDELRAAELAFLAIAEKQERPDDEPRSNTHEMGWKDARR